MTIGLLLHNNSINDRVAPIWLSADILITEQLIQYDNKDLFLEVSLNSIIK